MNFNLADWKEFKLQNLFTIKKGKRLTSYDQIDGHNNYVGAIDSNNGVSNHIAQAPIHRGNTISLSYNGSVGEAFYQYEPYWATDDVNALYPKFNGFNPYIGFFVCTILRKEKYKYSYGRKWTLYLMNNTVIKLPALKKDRKFVIDDTHEYSDEGYIPDWKFMEDYIKGLHCKPITTKNEKHLLTGIYTQKWKEFKISNLFDVVLSKGDIKIDDVEQGNIPLVSSGETNNGIVGYISNDGDGKAEIFDGNLITVDMFCNAFYQKEPFYAVSHGRVNILLPKFKLTSYIAMFICALIKQEQYKFSYGRAVYSTVCENIEIKLPILSNSEGLPIIDEKKQFSEEGYIPNWQSMDNYIKSLPYGDRI